MHPRFKHPAYPWIALLAGILMIARSASTIGVYNHTIDEAPHLASGVAMWSAKKHVLDAKHTPLAKLVAALPLVLSGVTFPELADVTAVEPGGGRVKEYADKVMFDAPLPYWSVLARARAMMLLFPAIVLLYVYRFGAWLGSPLVGMLSVVFLSLDPALLGHGALVGTDVPAAAGFLAATYHGTRFLVSRTARSAAVGGVALGLGIACKLSCLFVIPALGLLLIARLTRILLRRRPAIHATRKWRILFRRLPSIAQCVMFALCAGAALWACYFFNVGTINDQRGFAALEEYQRLPDFIKRVPMPMPSLPLGGLMLARHNRLGHPTYLNGEISLTGWWYYFPEVIALRCTIGMLLAMIIAAIAFVVSRQHRRSWRSLIVLLPLGVYMAFSISSNINLGMRHLMPALPLGYLLICLQLARPKWVYVALACIALSAFETARIHPDYLAFFNAASGGPHRGECFLLDTDFGQDVRRLADWLKSDEARGKPYTLRLFAGRVERLTETLGLDPAALTAPPAGLFAISKTEKHGLAASQIAPDGTLVIGPDYGWLSHYPLIKRIGYTIEVYDLTMRSSVSSSTIVNPRSIHPWRENALGAL